MLKKTITYTDFNGNERTEDFYFNITKAEAMEMELGQTGGFSEMLQRIIAAQDLPALIKEFKDFIDKSYGVKTPDGKGFTKIDKEGYPLVNEFKATEAYSVLFMELATDDKKAAEFVRGVLPKETLDGKPLPEKI